MSVFLRDRKRITVLLGALGAALLYFVAFVAPVNNAISRLERKIAARKQDWKELEELAREHRRLTQGIVSLKRGYPAGLVEHLVDQAALKTKLSALRPLEGEGFDLRLDRASPKEIATLLLLFQKESVQVDRIQLRGYRDDTTWDARLYLRR